MFNDDIDAVLIASPPATHYEITKAALNAGKKVLLEKPAVLQIRQLEELYDIAEKQHTLLHVAFHASFAKDLYWFLAHRSELTPHPIRKIICGFYDPYMTDGIIQPERVALGGCYIDSGVNALSVCDKLVPLDGFSLATCNEMRVDTSNGTTYRAEHLFRSDSCDIIIKTAWDKGINLKHTMIEFYDTDDRVELNHSQQKVIYISYDKEKTLYSYDDAERLFTHYCGVFSDFYYAVDTGASNKIHAYDIHRLLLSSVTGD